MAPKGENNNIDNPVLSVVSNKSVKSSMSKAASSASLNKVSVSTHPCLKHKISILRSSTTPPPLYRALMREITYNLGYEATYDLSTKDVEVSVCNEEEPVMVGSKLKEQVALIPILRSGLCMGMLVC